MEGWASQGVRLGPDVNGRPAILQSRAGLVLLPHRLRGTTLTAARQAVRHRSRQAAHSSAVAGASSWQIGRCRRGSRADRFGIRARRAVARFAAVPGASAIGGSSGIRGSCAITRPAPLVHSLLAKCSLRECRIVDTVDDRSAAAPITARPAPAIPCPRQPWFGGSAGVVNPGRCGSGRTPPPPPARHDWPERANVGRNRARWPSAVLTLHAHVPSGPTAIVTSITSSPGTVAVTT